MMSSFGHDDDGDVDDNEQKHRKGLKMGSSSSFSEPQKITGGDK